jgi:hypothetical protein
LLGISTTPKVYSLADNTPVPAVFIPPVTLLFIPPVTGTGISYSKSFTSGTDRYSTADQ